LLRFLEFLAFLILWFPLIFWSNFFDLGWTILLLFALLAINLFLLFIIRYAILFILIKNSCLVPALKSAALFLKKNWLKTLKLSFMLFLIIVVYGLVFFSLLNGGAIIYPLKFVNLILTNLGSYGFLTASVLTLLIGGLIQVLIFGFISAYQIIAWTIFFLEEEGTKGEQPVF